MSKQILYIIITLIGLLIVGGAIFFFFFRSSSTPNQPSTGGFFGFGSSVANTPSNTSGSDTNVPQLGDSLSQKVFKIADGPIAGAAFTQTLNPTTTLARYVRADNGHVLDIPLGVSGSVAKAVSNVTIPGIVSSVWTTNASSTVMQYVDSGVLKTVFMSFAVAAGSSASSTPARIRFLPNGIVSLALDPNGARVSYLLSNSNGGVDGYVSNLDGTNIKNLFTLPLSQTLLSWPSPATLLVQTKSAFDVPGVAYSVNANTGVLSPLLYASGLSVTANKNFTKVVYQTGSDGKTTTYSHDIATGKDAPLANNPLPEKCVWSSVLITDAYCALPLDETVLNYADFWHKGLVQTADAVVNLDTNTGIGTVITLPGDGGANAGIEQIVLSPDGKYLMFITRGDQALWGVRL